MSGWHKPALIAALLALAIAYAIAWRAPAVGTFHDDGVYLVTAKALAEGKGYRIISLPTEIPQTKYPIFFPLLLSVVWKAAPAFPTNLPLLKLIPLLSTFLWLCLSFRLLRHQGASSPTAAWIILLTAASSWVLFLGTMLLSEATFAALTTGALLALANWRRSPSLKWLLLAALLAALAFHTRTLGLALIGAVPFYLLLRRQLKPALLFAAIAALLCLPWILWVAAQSAAHIPTDAYYSQENYQSWNILKNFTLPQKLHIIGLNLFYLLFSPAVLAGLPTTNIPTLIAGLALGLLCCTGLFRARHQLPAVFIGAYFLLILAWAWVPTRFVVPVFPLLFWYGWQTLAPAPRLRLATGAILTAASAVLLFTASQSTIRLGHPFMVALKEHDDWQSLARLLDTIRRDTPPTAILAGNLDPLFYLYTGRKSVRGFAAEPYSLVYSRSGEPLGSSQTLLDNALRQGATHWVHTPNSAFLEGPYLTSATSALATRQPPALEPLHPRQTITHALYRILALP